MRWGWELFAIRTPAGRVAGRGRCGLAGIAPALSGAVGVRTGESPVLTGDVPVQTGRTRGGWEKLPDVQQRQAEVRERIPDVRKALPGVCEALPDVRESSPDAWDASPSAPQDARMRNIRSSRDLTSPHAFAASSSAAGGRPSLRNKPPSLSIVALIDSMSCASSGLSSRRSCISQSRHRRTPLPSTAAGSHGNRRRYATSSRTICALRPSP